MQFCNASREAPSRTRFEWEEKDIFCVPSWTQYRHGSHGEAVLFCFNDLPAMKALGLYREA